MIPGQSIPAFISDVIRDIRARHPKRPALVGVGGAQGSGKTHWCSLLESANRGRFAHFSLDDVYLTKAEREARARNLSSMDAERDETGQWRIKRVARPALEQLFMTRGPPGTHDLGLAKGLIARLGHRCTTHIPRFDKRADDRAPEADWAAFDGPAEAILLDGWCVGALAEDDGAPPLNDVEREDAEGIWRNQANAELRMQYAPFFATFDSIIYLQAPRWEIVRVWRGEQEAKTLGRPLTPAENAALDRFVMHYERVTRDMLAGHLRANWIVHLDESRNVVRIEQRS